MTRPVSPIRLLTAVPLCDGHDSAISTINLELIRHGIEVVYLGYHRSVRDIVRAAVQEDVRAVGISSYNGGHVEFFSAVVAGLRRQGAGDIGVFGGGGGTITRQDEAIMRLRGVGRIFYPGETLGEMVDFVKRTYGARRASASPSGKCVMSSDRALAKLLTAAEEGRKGHPARGRRSRETPLVIGVTGPGGAGKTTLIDELVLRLLRSDVGARVAILSHDPSIVGDGALLGDRATMIYSQDDRVFMRSMASRGQAGGLAAATGRCLEVLKAADPGFDVILVETVGIGQEAMPFVRGAVDRSVLVMSPDYGSRLQLQKIVMLDVADVVVINKSDLSQAPTAAAEVERRLDANGNGQRLISTTAKRHADRGVDELFSLLTTR